MSFTSAADRRIICPVDAVNIVLSSSAPKNCRQALEELLFFNPQQHLAHEGILRSLVQFGPLRLEETKQGLTVQVGELETQTLFAYDSLRWERGPVGLVVFLRTSMAEVALLHIAVHPDYVFRGKNPEGGLCLRLMEEMKKACSQIAGVERIILSYRHDIVLRVSSRRVRPNS